MREKTVTVRVVPRTTTGESGLSGDTTDSERLALIETLTREAWLLAGLPVPTYARHEAPVRLRSLR